MMSHEQTATPNAETPTLGLESEADQTVAPVSVDALFRALSNPRRRRILSILTHYPGGTARLETLVDRLASEEGSGEDADRQRITASLERHLRTLEELDLVDYDAGERCVTYHDNPRVPELLTYATLVENLHGDC